MSMATTQGTTIVEGHEEREREQVKRKGRFLFIFPTEWWETVSERHIGNDIYILSNRPIRNVYLNGHLLAESESS